MSCGSRDLDDSGVEEGPREEPEEDDEPKVCQVCGDTATGYHFNAMTCEGCKGFFRRAMKGTPNFRCAFQNKCIITKSNRRQCQSCRLQKCLSIGMLKELIMSDEAVEKRRMIIRKKRLTEEPTVLTQEQENIIQELLMAHAKTFNRTFSDFRQFRPLDRDENTRVAERNEEVDDARENTSRLDSSFCSMLQTKQTEDKKLQFTNLPHITDLSTYMIQNIISYAKLIKTFRALTIEDQISLLKGSAFEITQMRFNMLFNEQTGIWECGSLKYCMNDAERAGFQHHLLDPLMKFHYTLRKLHLHQEEYVLMQAISLFSPDRPGVTQHRVIDELQEIFAITLKTYISVKRSGPEKQLLFPKIMACLTEMRTMNEEHTKQVLQIQDIQPEMSPLVLEIVSRPC
ncbi:nuclear receptor subfamily 1 group I member 2 [Silurus meridionalis]|uniref:nuclear receptor subfamily 1 group I member 2 n=1 Tax=Silurus meridionalis TaxID=175797 RepID=UPI001EEB6746|nr:nuclear receptor subfamily 1 group I member 2 [Silurus meridionalis]XP_046701534.1 nuclear receptor subfamily 1 group I member 2 [Silurus meridionalis]XP_046701535.1 nuclear receptor subfamily 1 group I member 2 [Silurus meridionalis]XP_046701536.1 nuclear receptor subfamily 1 group I member 2 [Silurus meridionalis]XP_046701537.1 nuclear receptor subfamily 1 group I member 2 [Silurus meridionalis]XP_046701538.1 nuclear receptor subfamily 1 group I member 2 [Silurus meridionalis]XP_04670154